MSTAVPLPVRSSAQRMPRPGWTRALALGVTGLLSACAVGPDYVRPEFRTPATFKEAEGWAPANPGDALDRHGWWQLFGDTELDALARRVQVSNQNVAAALASYEQARALVREQRAGLFPSLSLSGSATRADNGGSSSRRTITDENGQVTTVAGGGSINNTYRASIGASWEPDVWGRLRRSARNAAASEQASAADLASATLSAQGELVTNYLSLRETDAEIDLLRTTIAGYRRALQIAQNRHAVGVAALSDVLSAQTQLYNAEAELEGLEGQRRQLEHAIAVLVGELPSTFTLPAANWNGVVPGVPPVLPSTLLERRPDIAAAERRVAAANEQIGIQRSAYFPSLALSASYGSSTSSLGDLFNASSMLWSLGLSATQTLFDAGARSARVAQAQASYDAAVASYRQTVLTAFQDIENQLSATRTLERQYALREQASQVADRNEQLILNQYRAGQVGYTDVVTAQASALNARRSLVQAALNRQTTAVALIQALGGGWSAAAAEPGPAR